MEHTQKPEWLKISIATHARYTETKRMVDAHWASAIRSINEQYITPAQFKAYKETGEKKGFATISNPLSGPSYHAGKHRSTIC